MGHLFKNSTALVAANHLDLIGRALVGDRVGILGCLGNGFDHGVLKRGTEFSGDFRQCYVHAALERAERCALVVHAVEGDEAYALGRPCGTLKSRCIVSGILANRGTCIHCADGEGEEAAVGHLEAVFLCLIVPSEGHGGASCAHRDGIALAVNEGGAATDVAARHSILQLEGLRASSLVDVRLLDRPYVGGKGISGVVEASALVEVAELRAVKTIYIIIEYVLRIGFQRNERNGFAACAALAVVLHRCPLPLSACTIVGLAINVDRKALARHGGVPVLAAHLVAGDGVVVVAVLLAVGSCAELEVVVLRCVVVVPAAAGVCGGGVRLHRTLGEGLADDGVFARMGGVFLHAPPLVVVVGIAFVGLRVRPEASNGNIVGAVLCEQGRTLGHEFNAAVLARGIRAAGDEAVVVLVGLGVAERHHLRGFAAARFLAQHVILAIEVAAIVEQGRVGRHTLLEIGEAAARLRCPASLSDGNQTGQGEPLHIFAVADVLGPECTLHPVLRGRGDGLVVRGLHVVRSVACTRRVKRAVALFAVDVVGSPGCIDIVKAQLCGLGCGSLRTRPAIDERTRGFHGLYVCASGRDGFVPDG